MRIKIFLVLLYVSAAASAQDSVQILSCRIGGLKISPPEYRLPQGMKVEDRKTWPLRLPDMDKVYMTPFQKDSSGMDKVIINGNCWGKRRYDRFIMTSVLPQSCFFW